MMLTTLIALVTTLPARADADAPADARFKIERSHSERAKRELAAFRLARFNLKHDGLYTRWSSVHTTEDAHYLVQGSDVNFNVRRYATVIAPRPSRVTEFRAAGPSRHFPTATYPSITPWVSVKVALDENSAFAARQDDDSKKWRAKRGSLDEQTMIIAVGRRRVLKNGHWQLQNVRVQRFFYRKQVGDQVSVSLAPADAARKFRTVRVSLNGVVGELTLDAAAAGIVDAKNAELIGFSADQRWLTLLASDGREYTYRMDAHGSSLHFGRPVASEPQVPLVAEGSHLRPLERLVLVPPEDVPCDGVILDGTTASVAEDAS